jgi:sulfur relay protein TusB/DsrH
MVKTDLANKLPKHGPIYVLNEDLQARGLTIENTLYQGISYPEFVELTLECKQVISW